MLGERKIGHLGTLDPAAEGLMVLAVGQKALKVVELFNKLPKEYEARIRFGEISSTYDREGVIEEVKRMPGVEIPTANNIKNVIGDRFVGRVNQIPPAYSAVKVGGERAYRKVRQGRRVNIPPRTVEIKKCEIISYEYPSVVLRIGCSSGTYIRTLANDLGKILRVGAYLEGLRRTKVGDWSLEDSCEMYKISWSNVIPLKEVLAEKFKVEITSRQAQDIRHGRDIDVEVKSEVIAWSGGLPIAILTPVGGGAHARKVL